MEPTNRSARRPRGRAIELTDALITPTSVATLEEPFQRGNGRTRSDHGGLGLGLAIVKSITQAHEGTLTLAGRDGGGLRVTVELPVTPTRE